MKIYSRMLVDGVWVEEGEGPAQESFWVRRLPWPSLSIIYFRKRFLGKG